MALITSTVKMTYKQLYALILDRIRSGELDGKLPSISELSREYEVSHNTVKKVIDQLKLQNLVYGQQGKGVFVNVNGLDEGAQDRQVVFFLHVETYDNPFYFEAFSVLRSLFEEDGCTVQFVNSIKQLEHLPAIDALVITEINDHAEREKLLQLVSPDKVLLFNRFSRDFHWVGTDNKRGGYIAIKHLYDLGHRRIGVISKELDNTDGIFAKRYQGVLQFAFEYPDMELCNYEIDIEQFKNQPQLAGEFGCEGLLREYPGVTAVFAFTAFFALGAYNHCQKKGISIPGDLSIIGFNDRDFTSCLSPPLTTIREDVPAVAKRVYEAVGLISSGEQFPQEITLPPHLVQRTSTAPLKLDD